jgi:hypothetical protein
MRTWVGYTSSTICMPCSKPFLGLHLMSLMDRVELLGQRIHSSSDLDQADGSLFLAQGDLYALRQILLRGLHDVEEDEEKALSVC